MSISVVCYFQVKHLIIDGKPYKVLFILSGSPQTSQLMAVSHPGSWREIHYIEREFSSQLTPDGHVEGARNQPLFV